jgi:DNA repair protein RadC
MAVAPVDRSCDRGTAAPRLSDAELVAVLLAGGRRHDATIQRAHDLLAAWGGLAALPTTSRAMLRHARLRDTQASVLLAAGEIAVRLARERVPDRLKLERPAVVARYLALRYAQRDQEVMGALFLDCRHKLLGHREVFRGTLHRAAVEPREILKECLLRGAAGVTLFHTHPSGDPTPSSEDWRFTDRMVEAGGILGVELVDHLVLGCLGRFVSLRARGGW